MTALYGIFGSGGFAREIMPIAKQSIENNLKDRSYELVFVSIEPDVDEINGYKVLTEKQFFNKNIKDKYFNISIGDPKKRRNLALKLLDEKALKPFSIFSENTVILDANKINVGAIFCPFTTITSNIEIGKFFQANLYSYIGHDCIIGDYVTFAPGVKCNGNVKIGNNVYAGAGCIIKQGTKDKPIIIGDNVIIGAGAVVTKSISEGVTVFGNPAIELTKENLRRRR